MCRHLGYLGPPVSVAELLLEPPHSLLRQSWAPADMRGGGTVNADGFGVGWYPPEGGAPVQYRRTVPMWTDANLPGLARSARATGLVGAVRSATVGMPVMETACAPFTDGTWLFSHNGKVAGWPDSLAGPAGTLPVTDLLGLDAPTDSAVLWALLRRRLRAGEDPAEAVAALVAEVAEAAPGSRLNLLLTDGRVLVGTAAGHALSVLRTPGAVLVGSEPGDDDPRWRTVPDGHLVVATADGDPTTRPLAVPRERIDWGPRSNSDEDEDENEDWGPMTVTEPVVDTHLTDDDARGALRGDALSGLTAEPKWLPPRWFYDARGSELFEEITTLPEYYPTRAEREALDAHATEIAELTGARALVELGSGSSEKTRLLLDALRGHGTLDTFVPLDVSDSALREAAGQIATDYPGLTVHGVVGDFTAHLELLPAAGPRLVAFLGGTIGNLLPTERAKFLGAVRDVLDPGEWLLLGTDLVKDPTVLVAAYDDDRGVTAEFNRNVLHVLNRELDADFPVAEFDHVARWNAEDEWIEMRLRARRAVRVRLAALGLDVRFAEGEEMRTEVSAKFRRERVAAELSDAGFALERWWTDAAGRFAVSLARAED
jgi:dimethylhistidine N-methyltransferase/ergothioneine biosynthesis protein EgtC